MDDTGRIARELRDPAAYRKDVREVGFLQTHISLLFFADDRVYKVKKPVDLGFLDFTTLERRRHFCEEEVRLNRRLAPRTYLGVVPITAGADGHLRVGGEGEAVEWAVEMRRLPAHRMLSSLLERGEIDNQILNSIVTLLAGFHAGVPTGEGVDEHGRPAAVTANVEENFEQLRPFVRYPDPEAEQGPGVLTAAQYAFLRVRARGFLATRRSLLEARVKEGHIREGHGDLHAGNVCLPGDGIVIYDCIEFSRRLRCGDVACDLAFLAMDLDHRGYPAFSSYLVHRYAEVADDPELPALMAFYKGYRAVVRGKVAAMTAVDPAVGADQRTELRRDAMRYLQLAVSYELPPAMILLCGLPASGKSWLAERLSLPLRAIHLRSDVRRKTLARERPTTPAREAYEAGLYAPEMKRRTYRSLLEDAVETLAAGHSVVVDATFSKREYRAPFVDAATRLDLPYYVVHVSAPDSVIRERLVQRARDPSSVSDADLDVYERARAVFEPPAEVPGGHVLEVASGAGIPEEESSQVLDRMITMQSEGSEEPER